MAESGQAELTVALSLSLVATCDRCFVWKDEEGPVADALRADFTIPSLPILVAIVEKGAHLLNAPLWCWQWGVSVQRLSCCHIQRRTGWLFLQPPGQYKSLHGSRQGLLYRLSPNTDTHEVPRP
eukprot:5631680-Amphidinium_carterae.1